MVQNQKWKEFYQNYRNIECKNENDLYFQVGKTINGSPISETQFTEIIDNIVKSLKLNENDNVIELCCGNGLITHPISFLVKNIYAFDFTPRLIQTAKKYKQENNIVYKEGDATGNFFEFFEFESFPNKFLMGDSAAYFSPNDIERIIERMIERPFQFYLTGIPNDKLKWNFYNTPERKQKYLQNVENNDFFNDGLGRWFRENEFLKIAEKFNLGIHFENYWDSVTNFRTNVLFSKD